MSIINQEYYDNLLTQIDNVSSCAELQATASIVIKTMQDQLAVIEEQLAKVNPILELLSAPTTPDEVIDWIKGLIDNVIKPLAAPALTYQSQTAFLVIQIGLTIDKIKDKANQFANCEIAP